MTITVLARRARDTVNGNTYHGAKVFIDGELAAVAPFQYGYGDQWQWSAAEALDKAGKMPGVKTFGNGSRESLWTWADRNGHKLFLDCVDLKNRKQLKEWLAE